MRPCYIEAIVKKYLKLRIRSYKKMQIFLLSVLLSQITGNLIYKRIECVLANLSQSTCLPESPCFAATLVWEWVRIASVLTNWLSEHMHTWEPVFGSLCRVEGGQNWKRSSAQKLNYQGTYNKNSRLYNMYLIYTI